VEVLRDLGVSGQTLQRWRNQFGVMKADGAKRRRELERENQRLKQVVADQALDIQALKEIGRGTSEPGATPPRGRDVRAVVRAFRALSES
jgi:hypothetical protein